MMVGSHTISHDTKNRINLNQNIAGGKTVLVEEISMPDVKLKSHWFQQVRMS